jgi:hypothetical protein
MLIHNINSNLLDWSAVPDRFKKGALLLGNGASRVVWDKFKYPSLFDEAKTRISHPLSVEDQKFFADFKTENFEQILSALSTAVSVSTILGQDPQAIQQIQQRYRSIQRALVEAVNSVHIKRHKLPDVNLEQIRKALLSYDVVYTTNYDLINYWAIMLNDDAKGFKDFFWSGPSLDSFDILDTKVPPNVTKVIYLHGGLHLYHFPTTGRSHKMRKVSTSNLLRQFGSLPVGAVPLFVSEGTADQKKISISRSSYLSFAYDHFRQYSGPLVVFGHSLGDSDEHLVDVIKQWGNRPIAISVVNDPNPKAITAFKGFLNKRIPRAQLIFFDAKTHPLGDPKLNVP